MELLDKTKQEISKTKDEISNLNIVITERTQKLQTIPDNDSEYQQLNRIDGNYLQWKKESLNRLVGELNDLQSKIGEGLSIRSHIFYINHY